MRTHCEAEIKVLYCLFTVGFSKTKELQKTQGEGKPYTTNLYAYKIITVLSFDFVSMLIY